MPDRRAVVLALALWGHSLTAQTPPDAAEPAPNPLEMSGHRGLMTAIAAAGGAPEPFTTDGCSGGLSSGWALLSDAFPAFAADFGGHPPWEACCVTHDRAYHDAGGARTLADSFAARLTADVALRACVQADGAARADDLAAQFDVSPTFVIQSYAALSQAMFSAVRLGGAPCSGLPWRWGYGFPTCLPELP
jgi:hypothetical protein